MAFKDLILAAREQQLGTPTGYEIKPGALDRIEGAGGALAHDVGQIRAGVRSSISQPTQPQQTLAPAKIAYSPNEKAFIVNGRKVGMTGATLRAIADIDEAQLGDMDAAQLPQGFVPMSKADVQNFFNRVRSNMESSPGALAWANAKSAAGGAVTAIPRALGFDVNNPLAGAEQEAYDAMSLREQVGADEGTFDSFTGFINDASRGAGSAAPAIAGGIAAGALTGGAALPAYLTGGAISAGSAFSSQSEAAQQRLLSELSNMSDEDLIAQSPEFASALDAGLSREEAINEIAFNASRAAGGYAALTTLPETLVAGGVLRRIPGAGALLRGEGPDVLGAILPKRLNTGIAGIGTRSLATGIGEGAQEVVESELSQQGADRAAGFDRKLGTYVDPRDFNAGMATGMVFGALSRGNAGNRAAEAEDAIRNNPLASAMGAVEAGDQTAVTSDDTRPAPTRDLYAQVRGFTQQAVQADSALRAAYGDDWPSKAQLIAQDPDGQTLLGTYMGAMRQREAAHRQVTQGLQQDPTVSPGQPMGLVGPNFGDVAGQQMALPGIGAPQPAAAAATSPEAAALAPQGQMSFLDEVGPQEASNLIARAMQQGNADMVADLMEEGAINEQTVAGAAQLMGVNPQLLMQRLEQMGAGMAGPTPGAAQEPAGAPPAPNLAERRQAQSMRQDEALAASQANPQALPPSNLQNVQQQITDLQAEIDRRTQASAAYPRTRMARQHRQEMARLQQELATINQNEPRTQLDTPAPAAAPTQQTPDGRPMGVTPSPLENPEPMSPGEAASRANTQAQRANEQIDVGANARQLAENGTREPAGDIAAQVAELTNPESTTDVVFVADGDPTIEQLQADPPEGVTAIYKKGRGLFLVADDKPDGATKAVAIRRRKASELDDAVMATLLQMPQKKADVLAESAATGTPPAAVQAVKNGAVAAEAATAPSKAQETIAKIKAKAPGAQVRVVPASEAQARRANLTPTVTPPAKGEVPRPAQLSKEDVERLAARLAAGMDSGATDLKDAREEVMSELEMDFDNPKAQYLKIAARAKQMLDEQAAKRSKQRAAPRAARTPPQPEVTPAAARAKGRGREAVSKPKAKKGATANDDERHAPLDLRDKAGIEAGTVTAKRGENVRIPETLITISGRNDGPLNLEVQSPNLELQRTLQSAIDSGRLEGDALARAQRALTNLKQLGTMLHASVDAARDRLLARFKDEGHTAEQGGHLANEPLSPGEMVEFAERVQEQAEHELAQMQDGTWTQKSSLFRRAAGVLMPDIAVRLNDEASTRIILKAVAEAEPEVLADLAKAHGADIRVNLLAKQVMRGASEVVGATHRSQTAETDAMGYLEPITRNDRELSHLTASEGIDDALAKTLNGWLQMFERETSSRVRDVTLMSMAEATQRYPGQVGEHSRASGLTFPIVRFGKGRGTVIAVDTLRLMPTQQIETLAHELGHVVGDLALRNADATTQKAVVDAYHQWRTAQGGKTTAEIWASRAPAALAKDMRPVGIPSDYALSFREWLADNIARWMVTDQQPKSVVEKFFATVAQFLRRVYEQVARKNPDVSVQSLMRGYVNGAKASGVQERLDPWEGLSLKDRRFLDKHVGADEGLRETTPERMKDLNYVERATEKLSDLRDGIAPLIDPARHKEARAEIAGRLRQTRGGDLWRRAVGLVTQGHQLADLYSNTPVGAPLRKVVRTRDKIGALARKLQEETNRAHETARTLSGDAREQLNSVMKDATLWNMHPDVPFDDPKNKHLTTQNERVTAANRRRYDDLRARWERMAKTQWGATEAYTQLRDSLHNLRIETLDQQIQNLTDLKAKRKTKASKALIDRKIAELETARDRAGEGGPYFPLMRNGRYIVSAQLPSEAYGQDGMTIAEGGEVFKTESAAEKAKSEYLARTPGARIAVEPVPDEGGWLLRVTPRAVYMFDTEAQARKALPRIEQEIRREYEYADGPNGFDRANEALKGGLISQIKVKDESFERAKRNTDPRFWAEMETILDEQGASPGVREAYQQLYLESLPEFSHRKSMLQRERVLGAGDDMLLAHAHRSRGAAHSLADITHGRELAEAMQDLKDADPIVGRELANSLQKGEDLARARQRRTWGNNIMNAITTANAAYSLSLSPGYVLANSAQPLAVSLPVLAGLRKGDGTVGLMSAGKHLRNAYQQVGTFFLGRGAEDFRNELRRLQGKETKASPVDYATNLLDRMSAGNQELRNVLEELLDRGRLDFSFLDSMEDALKGGYTKWGAIQRLGMAFPQQIEAMNRVVTAIAAYNTAKQEMGVTDDTNGALTDFVDSLVRRTQLDYTVANRPPLFNVPGLNVILQFKMYLQGMYMLFVDAGRKALRGATPDEQREGRATLAYLMMTHGAIGGVAGLGPIGALAAMAAKAAAGDDDELKDAETVLRQAMQDYVGEDLSNAVLRGLPTLIGVDAADKLGLPSLWDTKYMNISPRDSSAEGLDKAMLYAMGSPYANARRVWQGINEPTDRGLDALPAGVRAVARAARTGAQGIVDRDGDTFIPREDLTFADLGISALGFQPTKVQQAYARRSEERNLKGRIQTQREALIRAARNGEDVSGEIREFNAQVPPPFRITGATLSEAVQSKAQRDAGVKRRDDTAVAEMVE